MRVAYTIREELQTRNAQNKLALWAGRISECRNSGQNVKDWCKENGICEQTYYRWQKRLFEIAKAQQEVQFAEVTPVQPVRSGNVAVTVRIAGAYSQRCGCGHRGNGAPDFEVMLTDFNGADRVYIACGYTDLRRGIDGLAALVQQQFKLDPFTNTLFLFCGRRRDRIKALYWEGNGFVLLYKRLESGSFQWPRKESESRALTPQQYRWLMEGLSVDQPKAHKIVSGLEIV